ncbi:hypothetical protein B296_00030693, partial [Ensete ventricosum]
LRVRRGQPLAGCPLTVSDRPLRARRWQPTLQAGRNRPHSRVAAPCGLLPLQAFAPCKGALATTGHPCRGVSRGQGLWPGVVARGRGQGPWPQPAAPCNQPLLLAVLGANALNDSTRVNLITRSLKPMFHTKTLALIPLLGNLSRTPDIVNYYLHNNSLDSSTMDILCHYAIVPGSLKRINSPSLNCLYERAP